MKVLVVSDNHGNREALLHLKEMYTGKVDAFFHCGDSELEADDIAVEGYNIVRGNCDFGRIYPTEWFGEVDNHKILVTHGHLFNIKMNLVILRDRAKSRKAEYVFFGHTHELGCEYNGGILYLNPGSISLPRGRFEKTYALVEDTGTEIIVTFLDDSDTVLTDLTQIFKK